MRKAVKTYAQEQAEEADKAAFVAPPSKRKKTKATVDPTDDDRDPDFADAVPDDTATKPAKKQRGKKTKAVTQDEDEDAEAGPSKPSKKRKRKGTPPDTSWHAEVAERRVAKAKSKIRQLAPGQEEKRLRK